MFQRFWWRFLVNSTSERGVIVSALSRTYSWPQKWSRLELPTAAIAGWLGVASLEVMGASPIAIMELGEATSVSRTGLEFKPVIESSPARPSPMAGWRAEGPSALYP